MIKNKVKYFNAYARFQDAHTLNCENAKGEIKTVTADKIIIATGGRPSYPGIPGDKEFGITSDDVFSLEKAPGKTLVVGASYVALECAGFLTAFGYDTTVMVRSIFLRGFDQDMANRIGKYMEDNHTKMIKGATPSKLERLDGPDGQITVTFKQGDDDFQEKFDTVLFAMGRYALTGDICLEKAGVTFEKNGKFKCNDEEQTNIPNIYAIGDVIYGQLELTPVAIKAGMLLSKRLFEGATAKMDYVNVPTTIFTPIEYGTCGLTEEEAKAKYGQTIKTFH